MMTTPPVLPLRAVDALRRGDTAEAIRLLRAATPLDFQAAKDVIDAYRRGGVAALPHPAMHPATSMSSSGVAATPVIEPKVAAEQKAVAERMRQAAGFGLAQGRDAVDASRFRDRPVGVGGRSPGETPRSGSLLLRLAIVALAGYALYLFLAHVIHV